MPALNELRSKYGQRASFYVVYIQEAHPVDAWQMKSNIRERILVKTTRSTAERTEAATACAIRLGLQLPALIDTPDDRTERAYTGWPDRLYVIDRDGKVAYKSAAGPFGFKPAEVEATLVRLLPRS